MQRILDILLSSIALLLLLPVLLPIVLILRFSGEGEIFYPQDRVGKHGRIFRIYKFATMLKNSPNLGTGTVTVKNDPRVLPVGRFLRKTKFNELPQLINILNGTMSLIGPRPQTRRCFQAFPSRSQEAIVRVRPGLSGIGSIVFRDEESLLLRDSDPDRLYDEIIMPYKGELEEWYERNRGLKLYLFLILLTVWVVLSPDLGKVWRLLPSLPRPRSPLTALLGVEDFRG